MYTPLHCISLRTIRHSDSRAILSAWSAELGRVAIGMPDGKGREASRRRALTMPLATFECVADIRPGREIINVRDVKPSVGSPAMATPNPSRQMTSMFLAETLDAVLRQSGQDSLLSDYLFSSLSTFGQLRHPVALANFHLVFLTGLTRFLGIVPDTNLPSGMTPGDVGAVFDLRNACFRKSIPSHPLYICGDEAMAVHILGRLTYANMHRARFTRQERVQILDGILNYYRLHLSAPAKDLQSLTILRGL